MPIPQNKEERAQAILNKAFAEIRTMGLAPVFKWGVREKGEPNKLAAHITDFDGFHELPVDHD